MPFVEMYFDSSDSTNIVTLSAFVSQDHIWRNLESEWKAVLDEYQINSFHMTDAWARKKKFKGWEKEKVKKLLHSLLEVLGKYRTADFECYSCIIAKEDYNNANIDLKSNGCKLRPIESICVNECAGSIPFPKGCTGIKLFFDQNEKFMHKINHNWEKLKKQGSGWARQIKSIEAVDSSMPGIQAADIFAWWYRRYYEKPNHPENKLYLFILNMVAGLFHEYFDLERIKSSYPMG